MQRESVSPPVNIHPWPIRMADSVMRRNVPFQWHYEHGLALKAIEEVWLKTREAHYWQYIKDTVDPFILPDGSIKSYAIQEYNLDQINPGKILFRLYRMTGEEKYRQAIYLLHEQLRTQPRNGQGGFWHKKIYPHQMWLDGVYMAAPFYAEFGETFGEPGAFDDVAQQITLIHQHNLNSRTGLLYHGWDASRQQRWADPVTGCSPHFWGRAMGWYVMALVDVLDYFPFHHAARPALISILQQVIAALARVQDAPTGLWYQVLDQGPRAGNYLEASASCMVVYAISKGVRKGYLAPDWLDVARRGYRGILGNLIEIDPHGLVNLNWTCGGAGLGGSPYRDGSYQYYVGERIIVNDYKGVGPFILAGIEMERTGAA